MLHIEHQDKMQSIHNIIIIMDTQTDSMNNKLNSHQEIQGLNKIIMIRVKERTMAKDMINMEGRLRVNMVATHRQIITMINNFKISKLKDRWEIIITNHF
jgi:hypothetical protein